MIKFSTFIFESFSFDEKSLKASFYYSFDNWSEIFEEIINFRTELVNAHLHSLQNKNVLNNFLFNLHIALWISYYKLFPTKTLEIKSWYLNSEQILFWEKFYRNWLWEFFITNNLDFSELINFKNIWKTPDFEEINIVNDYINNNCRDNSWIISTKNTEKNLLLWWGWKDSITSLILLEEKKTRFICFLKNR
jgi:hypothetical protein